MSCSLLVKKIFFYTPVINNIYIFIRLDTGNRIIATASRVSAPSPDTQQLSSSQPICGSNIIFRTFHSLPSPPPPPPPPSALPCTQSPQSSSKSIDHPSPLPWSTFQQSSSRPYASSQYQPLPSPSLKMESQSATCCKCYSSGTHCTSCKCYRKSILEWTAKGKCIVHIHSRSQQLSSQPPSLHFSALSPLDPSSLSPPTTCTPQQPLPASEIIYRGIGNVSHAPCMPI